MYKSFATLTRFGVRRESVGLPWQTASLAIALSLLLASKVSSLPTEYVFTAPPEVDLELEEIPTREEYPLYECSNDVEDEEVLDSHNCSCIDCEDTVRESKEDKELTWQNQQDKE